jgi:hypothetical protein
MRRMGTRESTSGLQVLLGIAALSANLRGTTDMAMCRLVVNSWIVNPNIVTLWHGRCWFQPKKPRVKKFLLSVKKT